jgi:hypothetical protein
MWIASNGHFVWSQPNRRVYRILFEAGALPGAVLARLLLTGDEPVRFERGSSMSTKTPRAQPSRKRTVIIGAAIVVLLAIIAIVVASQAIRASEGAAARDSASVEPSAPAQATDGTQATPPTQTTSPTQNALTGQDAELVDEANTVCEMRLTEKYPTATISPGTKSTMKKADGTFDTAGSYTDGGNSSPIPFECSSTRTDGSWTVVLKPAKNG